MKSKKDHRMSYRSELWTPKPRLFWYDVTLEEGSRLELPTDMSWTRGLPLILIWLRPGNQNLYWYNWDAKLIIYSVFTLIWRRRLGPNLQRYDWDVIKIVLGFTQFRLWQIKKSSWEILGRMSYICVSVISLKTPKHLNHLRHPFDEVI